MVKERKFVPFLSPLLTSCSIISTTQITWLINYSYWANSLDKMSGRHKSATKKHKTCNNFCLCFFEQLIIAALILACLIILIVICVEGVKAKNFIQAVTSDSGIQSIFSTALPPSKFSEMFAEALKDDQVTEQIKTLMREVLDETFGFGAHVTVPEKRGLSAYTEICKSGADDYPDPSRLCELIDQACQYFSPCIIQHNQSACSSFASEAFMVCAGT